MESLVTRFRKIEKLRLDVRKDRLNAFTLAEIIEVLNDPIAELNKLCLTEPTLLRKKLNENKGSNWSYVLDIKSDQNGFPIYFFGRIYKSIAMNIPVVVDELFISNDYNNDRIISLHQHFNKAVVRLSEFRMGAATFLKANNQIYSEEQLDAFISLPAVLPIWQPLNPEYSNMLESKGMVHTMTLIDSLKLVLNLDHTKKGVVYQRLQEIQNCLGLIGRKGLASTLEHLGPRVYSSWFDRLQELSQEYYRNMEECILKLSMEQLEEYSQSSLNKLLNL